MSGLAAMIASEVSGHWTASRDDPVGITKLKGNGSVWNNYEKMRKQYENRQDHRIRMGYEAWPHIGEPTEALKNLDPDLWKNQDLDAVDVMYNSRKFWGYRAFSNTRQPFLVQTSNYPVIRNPHMNTDWEYNFYDGTGPNAHK